ncbi:MAG: SDR family NAD(P)-dependent oxidoreductase [Spirochaetaceae bacterium]|nr:SDR family NAD(P)-dependent oxidoreductase [Spirochaetaceae bacterium]
MADPPRAGGRLAGRTALITGAGSGMGRSAAELFAAEGAHVVAGDRDAAAVDATVACIRAAGGSALGAVVDVTRSAEVEAAVQSAVRTFGALHVLYNNAGVWLPDDGPAPDLEEEVWDRIIAVNLKGAYLGCKFAIPHLVSAGGGSIINVSSISALRAGKDIYDAYAASKGGVITFTRSVASTWGPKRVRANAICPGSIDTPMTHGSYEDPFVARFWRERTALGRVGAAEEVAQTALWLASDESSYVTGAVIVVDGGYMTR